MQHNKQQEQIEANPNSEDALPLLVQLAQYLIIVFLAGLGERRALCPQLGKG